MCGIQSIKNGDTIYLHSEGGLIRCDFFKETGVFFLSDLIVDENWRHLGEGTKLIMEAHNYRRKHYPRCRVIALEVDMERGDLIRWYKDRFGFVVTGYGMEGNLMMTKILDEEPYDEH